MQMPLTRSHPQTPVVDEDERSDGRVYHRCVEDERKRAAGRGISMASSISHTGLIACLTGVL